ncbi:hypothetical protein SEVIR_1G190066v4 [Setaria viridis]
MRNTLNFWLDGATPAVPLVEVLPFLFHVMVSRPSMAGFIVTLGELHQGRCVVHFFPDKAAAAASIPCSNSLPVVLVGSFTGRSAGVLTLVINILLVPFKWYFHTYSYTNPPLGT